jgi:hypothetical protein
MDDLEDHPEYAAYLSPSSTTFEHNSNAWPYSSDFDPVEPASAKLKALLRQAEDRTLDGLGSQIGEVLGHFSATECRHYFRHCGYTAASA